MLLAIRLRVASALRGFAATVEQLADRVSGPVASEIVRRVATFIREHPGASARELKDATARIMTDYYIEKRRQEVKDREHGPHPD